MGSPIKGFVCSWLLLCILINRKHDMPAKNRISRCMVPCYKHGRRFENIFMDDTYYEMFVEILKDALYAVSVSWINSGQAWLMALHLGLVAPFSRFRLRLTFRFAPPSDRSSRFRSCLRLMFMLMKLITTRIHTYRGLSPHKFTPMPGVPQGIKLTARPAPLFSRCRSAASLYLAVKQIYLEPFGNLVGFIGGDGIYLITLI